MKRKPKIGLVLGSGSARGWAHIGVVQALVTAGIKPDVVSGCSIGAFVGAAYANGDIDKLERWVSILTRQDVVSLLDVSWRSGFIKGNKLIQFFEEHFVNRDFSELQIPFACVATDLESGREIWLREGNVARAVRASIALPGLFTPVPHNGGFLVDGALVNPVPVSLCRANEADIVIAVDLTSDVIGRTLQKPGENGQSPTPASWAKKNRSQFGLRPEKNSAGGVQDTWLPPLLATLSTSINIMQVRITRSRLAGEPADVLIVPRLGQLGLMDYHRGEEAIAEGREAVQRMLPLIKAALGQAA